MRRIILASDHTGFDLKRRLMKFLERQEYRCEDMGCDSARESCDYPQFAALACQEFLKTKVYDFGVLVCGTGIGISIAANRYSGIRCALPQNTYAAKMAKEHNNANFMAFGARVDYQAMNQVPEEMLQAYCQAEFDPQSKHARRIILLDDHEQSCQ